MADIKTSTLFNKGSNKAMDKIRDARLNQKIEETNNEVSQTLSPIPTSIVEKKVIQAPNNSLKSTVRRSVGAPIKRFDKVYKATQPIKLSALLNSTVRILSEKYMANHSKDEILRNAIDAYIQSNLASEDRQALLSDVEKDLALFRESHPTKPEVDHDTGITKRTVEEIEKQTLEDLKEKWKTK